MARYIDADLLLSCPVRIQGHISLNNGKAQNFEAISIKEIENAPTADVVPVARGEWKQDENETYRCSECGILWALYDGTPLDNEMHYCPVCGARMDGEGK